MQLTDILKFMWSHPLNEGASLRALLRFLRWQVGSRILDKPVVFPWVNEARLVVGTGMTAATGNIYVGLLEFEEMAFVLHYLRPEDVFFDIGANIGAYTVLAGKAVGTRCLAVEPIADTYSKLMDNMFLNRIQDRVTALNIGLGRVKGRERFSTGSDSTNRVLDETETDIPAAQVEILPLDEARGELCPAVIKIDVEGFESEVVAGAGGTFCLPDLNAVLMELRGHGARYGFDEYAVNQLMTDLNFKACRYDPFQRTITELPENGGHLGDMLYIRDIAKARHRVSKAPKFKVNNKWV